jgi:hypothetical protein
MSRSEQYVPEVGEMDPLKLDPRRSSFLVGILKVSMGPSSNVKTNASAVMLLPAALAWH